MNFEYSDEERLIQKTARDFADKVLVPRAAQRDRDEVFPEAELRELAELGMLGVSVDERYGGTGAGPVSFSLVMQELARADASVAVAVSVTNMVAELIAAVGTEAQKQEHIPRIVGGAYLCAAFALSEPAAGSNPAAMTTRATRVDGGWKLSGTKQWISQGDRSGLLVVWAMTDPAAGRRGISAFLVPGNAPGVIVNRAEEKMGLRGSTTVQLGFDDVRVPDAALLGELGDGFRLAMIALDGGRIGIASQALGISRCAFEAARRYALEREQFGVAIAHHQAISGMLADCATWIEAGQWMTLRAAWRKQRGLPFSQQAAMAKLFTSERASAICDHAIQIHGGYGYTVDFPVERAYRDARVTRIYEGTSEIQRIVIARTLIQEMRT